MNDKTEHIPLPSVSEVVLKTDRFMEMNNWYEIALDSQPFLTRERPKEASWTGSQRISFFKLHGIYPYAQMLGIFEVDGTKKQVGQEPGLHHFQLSHGNLEELFARYDNLKTKGILPIQKWNHGVMTSFYYEDPDGNQAEMTCVNFKREEGRMVNHAFT